ncbi:MAG: GNAT family N-acetyltransferase, partial [Parachlamydiaceae bacterium]
ANIAHINSHIIAESFRHQGLGTLLLGLLERWLKRQGYQTIMAISTPESYSFYLRRGYRLVSSNHNKCDPKEIEMQKTL